MNWQLLKNVNPPIGEIILLFDTDSLNVVYARRVGLRGQTLQFSSTYKNGGIGIRPDEYDYKDFIKAHGEEVYWALFVKP